MRFGSESHLILASARYLGIEVDDALEMAEQTEVDGLTRPVSGRSVACRPAANARLQHIRLGHRRIDESVVVRLERG